MSLLKTGFLVVLAAAAFGCASDKLGDDDGGDPGPGSGGDPTPPEPPTPVDASGSYRIHSTFDIAQNMPGTVGTVVNGVIAATDDPNDPMSWVVTQVINTMPDGTFKDLLIAAEPFIASELNDQLLTLAPDFTNMLLRVGHDLEDVAKHFGLSEQLDVVHSGPTYVGTITADGVELNIENTPMAFSFTEYDMENVVAPNLPVQLDATSTLGIGRHRLPLSYGKILRIALDAGIIPLIDANAGNLGELLNGFVDCQAVGQQIADAVGFGGPAMWAGACVTGLNAAADQIYNQIVGIDSSLLEFQLDGTAKASDQNHDFKIDHLDNGVWTGLLSYSGTDADLGPATFVGARQ
jgi:hypothetical protein